MNTNKKLNVITGRSIKEVITSANSLNITASEFVTFTQTKEGDTFILIYYK